MQPNENNVKYQKMKLGWIPTDWKFFKLCDVAEILFSNVDKKKKSNEKAVYLCNYMDVYYNDYIRADMQFMKASANQNEIKKFSLKKGDVIITKDSETQNDIAIPSVVIEDLKNVLCGYHLAILRSNIKQLNGLFLMHLLNSTNINHQFVRLANGITRFGLNTSSVENALVPLPPLPEQKKIAKILSTWDDAIATTEKLIAAKEKLKKGLMQQLLTGKKRFKEFEGNGKYKKTKLGLIPDDWEIRKFDEVTKVITCGLASTPKYVNSECGMPFLSAQNVQGNKLDLSNFQYISKELHNQLTKNTKPQKGDLLYTRVGAGIGQAALIDTDIEFSLYVSLTLIKVNHYLNNIFLLYLLNSNYYRYLAKREQFAGGGVQNLNVKVVKEFSIPVPSNDEQQRIATLLSTCDKDIQTLKDKLKALQKQKEGLMQQLLTGKVRVKIDS